MIWTAKDEATRICCINAMNARGNMCDHGISMLDTCPSCENGSFHTVEQEYQYRGFRLTYDPTDDGAWLVFDKWENLEQLEVRLSDAKAFVDCFGVNGEIVR